MKKQCQEDEQEVEAPQGATPARNQQASFEAMASPKSTSLKKLLTAPDNRLSRTNHTDGSYAKTTMNAQEEEQEVLTPARSRTFPSEAGQLQECLPDQGEQGEEMPQREPSIHVTSFPHLLFRGIGPGLLSGTSGNDPSAVTVYAIDGATTGYGQLWLLLLTTPLYFAVQFACAKIGCLSQKRLSHLLREHYGWPVAWGASLLLVISNIALIAADLAAIGSGFELLTGITWVWFVVPVALLLWYLTISRTFKSFTKIFLTMSLVFVTYVLTSFCTPLDWRSILVHTVGPHLGFNFASISSAVALLY